MFLTTILIHSSVHFFKRPPRATASYSQTWNSVYNSALIQHYRSVKACPLARASQSLELWVIASNSVRSTLMGPDQCGTFLLVGTARCLRVWYGLRSQYHPIGDRFTNGSAWWLSRRNMNICRFILRKLVSMSCRFSVFIFFQTSCTTSLQF